ncbi:MAG: universal stress protein [Terriglobales bacterium]
MRTLEAGKRIAVKNVLFATDFSPCSNAALPHALSVARHYAATLYAAHVMPTKAEMVLLSPETWPTLAEEEDKWVRSNFKRLESWLQEVPHEVLMPIGKVATALGQVIEERKIDLLVLGTHGRTGVGKLFMGSVAEEIFRGAACPVLTIGPHVAEKTEEEIHFHRVLFATDFSDDSLAALPYALSLAEEDQAQLTVSHVVEQPAAGIPNLEEVTSELMKRLQRLVPREAETWCHAEYLLEFGRQFAAPVKRILEIAKYCAADLIVLGVRPVHGKLGLMTHLASTTAQILTQAECPVLTVRGGLGDTSGGQVALHALLF